MDAEFDAIYQQELFKPLDWLRHDTNTHNDRDIQELCDMWAAQYPDDRWAADAAYGLFWEVAECLALSKEHCYPVRTNRGKTNLIHDISIISRHTEKEVEDFMQVLYVCGLLDREAYENGNIISNRILRNAEEYAAQSAAMKVRSKKGARKRWQNKDDA